MRVVGPCCATTILSRMLNARYHRVLAYTPAGACGFFTRASESTTDRERRREGHCRRLPRDTDAAGAASSRTDTRRIHTRSARETAGVRGRERERATHTAATHGTAHACARCENRRSSATPSCSPSRSSSQSPRPSHSHSLSVTALSLPLGPSHPSRHPALDYLTDKGYVNGDIRAG